VASPLSAKDYVTVSYGYIEPTRYIQHFSHSGSSCSNDLKLGAGIWSNSPPLRKSFDEFDNTDAMGLSVQISTPRPQSYSLAISPAAIATELACDGFPALCVIVLVALQLAIWIADLDVRLLKHVHDGADAAASSAAIGAVCGCQGCCDVDVRAVCIYQ
jgi:hypothetical protein